MASGKKIDLSSFNNILEINSEQRWALVEPRVSFYDLSLATLKEGLIPPVVPEFTSITVGGAVMGAALESSSHRFGQVSDTTLEYEVVLGSGEKVMASPSENADLFYGLSGSYGTLGILTTIKIQLIEAKPFVHLSYQSLSTKALLDFVCNPPNADFIEGVALGPEGGIAIAGQLTSEAKAPLYRQNHYWSPWYIQHLTQLKNTEEVMPLQDYLFRLDRGAFWVGRYVLRVRTLLQLLFKWGVPKISQKPPNPSWMLRLLFGGVFKSQKLYDIWHRIPTDISEKLFFIHDFYTPLEQVKSVYEKLVEETAIYPIWLCPVVGTSTPQILAPHYGKKNFLNIGVYGMLNNERPVHVITAELEKMILDHGGRKMLYSYTYYERDLFEEFYHEKTYRALRKNYQASLAFPHLYDKIVNFRG